MALNRYMHPRNIYCEPPVFKDLALKYPDLRKHMVQGLDGQIRLDFKNPDALRALTTALLLNDFGLKVTIPDDRLVPTVPLRLNYILWIEDLLTVLPANDSLCSAKILGLDIGTGATCIYPLLGSQINGWHFLAVDSDDEALDIARRNVLANGLQDKISVIKSTEDSILSGPVLGTDSPIDFCMCNPPFFKDEAEANSLAKRRSASRPPPRHGASRAKPGEAITEGGESAFVDKMIKESEQLGSRIRIYTTMFGKKTSVAKGVERVSKANGIWTTTEFCQGRTMRWGLAWTFLEGVRIDTVKSARKLEMKSIKSKEKSHSPVGFILPKQLKCCGQNLFDIQAKVKEILSEIQITVKATESSRTLKFMANSNTWSHQRRKRRAAAMDMERQSSPKRTTDEQDKCELTRVRTEEHGEIVDALPAVEGLLFVQRTSSTGDIDIKIQWTGGSLGKDAANQILQFLKNKLL